MAIISTSQINRLLTEVGSRYQEPANLVLLGGSALHLLGNPRPTFDIDYVGHDLHKDALQQVVEQVAQEMGLEVEAVPIGEFIPLSANAQQRQIPVGSYGSIQVFILDPYAIALSKIDRGFDSDIEDVLFLLRQKFIILSELEAIIADATIHAAQFDLNPTAIEAHLTDVRNQLV